MLLVDFLADQRSVHPVQIFGTDISDVAVNKARAGFYVDSMVAKVPEDLFQRYFTKVEQGYRVNKLIREVCVFSRQDLARDPPFSKVDLISCRNVLIYLGTELQNKVLPIFHYAINPDGYLLLGNSETVGASHLFTLRHKSLKIYRKKASADRPPLDFPPHFAGLDNPSAPKRAESWTEQHLQKEADRIVLSRYGPAGVVIDDQLEIVQFRGDLSPFLKPASGAATLNFLKMVREDMAGGLRAAIDLAKRGTEPPTRCGLRVHSDELRSYDLNVHIIPIDAPPRRGPLLLVLFETAPHKSAEAAGTTDGASSGDAAGEIERLTEELTASRRHLYYLMDERQATEEELRSANEEILSSNEELQSTNEELETSQEELQSANEELTTVNDELQHRNNELS